MKSKTFDQVLQLMLKKSILSSSTVNGLEGFLFVFNYTAYSLKGWTPAVFFSRHNFMPQLEQQLGCQAGGWSGNCLLGPALRWRLVPSVWYTEPRQPSPLEWCRWTFLCHQSHLQGERKDLEVSTLALLTSQQTSVISFGRDVQTAEAAFHI